MRKLLVVLAIGALGTRDRTLAPATGTLCNGTYQVHTTTAIKRAYGCALQYGTLSRVLIHLQELRRAFGPPNNTADDGAAGVQGDLDHAS